MSSADSQSKAGQPAAPGRGTSKRPYPGYTAFRKVLDFGQNQAGVCFDLENYVKRIVLQTVGPNEDAIVAQPVFLVDPCQINQTPIKTQTIISSGFVLIGTGGVDSITGGSLAGAFTGKLHHNFNLSGGALGGAGQYASQLAEDFGSFQARAASTANTAQTFIFDTRNLVQILAIHSDSTGGTSTVVVSGSADSTNFLQIDSIATAAVTDLQYTLATNALNGAAQAGTVAGTGASTVKLNPLAFRYIKVVIGAAGVGIVNTTTIAMK